MRGRRKREDSSPSDDDDDDELPRFSLQDEYLLLNSYVVDE